MYFLSLFRINLIIFNILVCSSIGHVIAFSVVHKIFAVLFVVCIIQTYICIVQFIIHLIINKMKAIVNVNKGSAYNHLNGLTFTVDEVKTKVIVMNINGTITDFSHTEVLIVDLNEELQRQYDSYNWGSQNCFRNLELYAFNNGILHKEPQYSCPA